MKKRWRNNLIIAMVSLFLFLACAQKQNHGDHADTYTCPMHPTVVTEQPGICPVCGMDLVRKARPGEDVEITEDLSKLLKSPNEAVRSSIKTTRGTYKIQPVTMSLQGVVTYDPKNVTTLSSRVSGRLEAMTIKYEFQKISKGQKVAEIYSPELVTAQRELIFLLDHDASNTEMIDAAKNRLLLLGFSSAQLNQLIQKKSVFQNVSIYSNSSGYVVSKLNTNNNSETQPSASMSGGMNSSTNAAPAPIAGDLPREGSYVNAAQTLFTVIDPEDLRLEFRLPSLSAAIKKGDKLSLDFEGGQTQEGTVDLVQQFITNDETFVKLRVIVKRTGGLHVGHLVNATVKIPQQELLWVSRSAVVSLGKEQVVFVKEHGTMKPRKIETGIATADSITVVKGLSSTDEIAINAQFLVDSESFIKTEH